MKDLSFFVFKNSLGAKMKKGIRNFCNGDGSTCTLNQQKLNNNDLGDGVNPSCMVTPSPPYLNNNDNKISKQERQPTLEEMILQLELEEEMAKQAKLNEYSFRGRMSCVNNSDILRSARNALNQYPRFSLDGKDAMYRSSFRNLKSGTVGRKSVCCDHGLGERFCERYNKNFGSESDETSLCLPPILGGESVIWCKPGVVAKLMGLEAVPVPIISSKLGCNDKLDHGMRYCILKRQNLRRRAQKHGMERRLAMPQLQQHVTNNCDGVAVRVRRSVGKMGSCSKGEGYCEMKPAVAIEPTNIVGGGWPTRRFR